MTQHQSIILAARPAHLDELGWIGNWSPGIGDPTLVGWFTVIAYLLAFALTVFVGRRLESTAHQAVDPRRRERRFWALFSWLLALLAVNKQLDLQTAFTEYFRLLATTQGWYESRRVYQHAFIELLTVSTVVGAVALLALLWRLPRPLKIAGVGLCCISGFVLIRATSLHEVDSLIAHQFGRARLNWLLELSGIAITLIGALARLRQLSQLRTRSHSPDVEHQIAAASPPD